jgi:1,4-alpha-glucan branching enzyme
MPQGNLCLVLHAHLPFVRHPEYDDFLEEDWLYEAITETYVPLLEVFDGLRRDGVGWRLTLSVSPTLAAMLSDPLLQYRYVRHLDNLIALAGREVERTRWHPEFQNLALLYQRRFLRCREVFVRQYDHNLLAGFRRFADAGNLELITCAATHGFLPLMGGNRNAMQAQIELGAREFERHFGRRPPGIWLPECGYAPGVDELLAEAGLRYFFVDTHVLLNAEPRPRNGVYAPVLCPKSGVAAFGRDTLSSAQVWSSVDGYPGDPAYREFYRDVGFDLDYDYLRPHLHQSGGRSMLGLKYYRITGPTDDKEPYQPAAAMDRAALHAEHFLRTRQRQVGWLAGEMDRPPVIAAPYDAELFGHWWFEGPDWLNFLLRKLHFDQETIQTITAGEYLDRHAQPQHAQPTLGSWGAKGYCEVWLERSNDWIYPHLHTAADRMVELARAEPRPNPLRERALNQAARELLLAQASDWAFIMKTGTTVEYARRRTCEHIDNFHRLDDQLRTDAIDEASLADLERRHNLFPAIDYRVYA